MAIGPDGPPPYSSFFGIMGAAAAAVFTGFIFVGFLSEPIIFLVIILHHFRFSIETSWFMKNSPRRTHFSFTLTFIQTEENSHPAVGLESTT